MYIQGGINMSSSKKIIKAVLIFLVIIFVILSSAFIIWNRDFYHADEIAKNVLVDDGNIKKVGNLTILSPSTDTDTGIIFYPGGKVEAIAYLPILEKLKNEGYTCVLVEMPFNLAFFNKNAADKVYEEIPDIKKWYIAGHSLGGAMASAYASNNQDKVEGLILLGAYVYGDYPSKSALTIYGTFNSNLEENINYTDNIVIIDGGNHAQFGNYGRQKGDPDATISAEEQQDIAVKAITSFIEDRK